MRSIQLAVAGALAATLSRVGITHAHNVAVRRADAPPDITCAGHPYTPRQTFRFRDTKSPYKTSRSRARRRMEIDTKRRQRTAA